MRKKRVLLFSEGFGTGHTKAAYALSVGLRQQSSDLQTRVLELGAFLHPTLAPFIFSAYRKAITSRSKLYGFVYKHQYNRSLNRFVQLVLHRLFYSQTAELIEHLKPDMIVCTHPFPNAVVSRLKRSGLSVPLCTVITDYDLHGTWISAEVNKYLVSTTEVKQKLMVHGIPETRIEVTGIPVHPNFRKRHDREQICRQFGLKNMPTVLIMGGGWGLFQNAELLYHMAGWRDHIQLIFCLGDNEKVRSQMAEDSMFRHPNVHLFGYTREVDKLMDVADLLITKPGGMTCTEGLAKGLPMLFYSPILGPEEKNCQYFTALGLGERIESAETIDRRFKQLLRQKSERDGGKDDSRQKPAYDPTSCCRAILRMLSEPVESVAR